MGVSLQWTPRVAVRQSQERGFLVAIRALSSTMESKYFGHVHVSNDSKIKLDSLRKQELFPIACATRALIRSLIMYPRPRGVKGGLYATMAYLR